MKSKILSYYRLLRGTNLIFIMLIMYIIRYFLIVPWMRVCNDFPFFSDSLFHLLVIATVFIAAAGYVINDYFDQVIDGINKSSKQIVGVKISARVANLLFWILSIAGSVIGIFVSFKIGHVNLGSIFIVASFMVYYYSLKYKRLLLWGNIVVAFLSALVVLLPWLFEFFALLSKPEDFITHISCLAIIRKVTFLFVGFSFVTTLVREWVKDLEDRVGDEFGGKKTLPVRFGVKKTKLVTNAAIVLFILGLAIAQWQLIVYNYQYVAYYSMITVSLPLIYMMAKLIRAQTPDDYHFISSILKIVMFFGILTLVISYIIIFKFQY